MEVKSEVGGLFQKAVHPISGLDKEDNEYTSIIKVLELVVECIILGMCIFVPLVN
jgi:hypothetical protein